MSIITINGNEILSKLFKKTIQKQQEKYYVKYFPKGVCGINLYILFIDTMFSIMTMFENKYEKYSKIIINFNENSENIPKRKNIWIAKTRKVLKSEDFLFKSAYALKGMTKFLTKNERKEYEMIDKFFYDNVKPYISSLPTGKYVGNYKFDKAKYLGKFMKNLICYQGMLEDNEIKFLFIKILSYVNSDRIIINNGEFIRNNDSIFDFLQISRGIILDTNPDYSYDMLVENKDFKLFYINDIDNLLFENDIYEEITSEFNIISKEDIIDYTMDLFEKFNKKSKMFILRDV